jgi:hypothetical protein
VDEICGFNGCENMCTNATSAGTGVVQSPNFPSDYGNDRECHVNIVVPAGKRIQFAFTTFNLETGKGEISVSNASISNRLYFIISTQSPFILDFVFLIKFTRVFSPY